MKYQSLSVTQIQLIFPEYATGKISTNTQEMDKIVENQKQFVIKVRNGHKASSVKSSAQLRNLHAKGTL
jgi:hypothetical protein